MEEREQNSSENRGNSPVNKRNKRTVTWLIVGVAVLSITLIVVFIFKQNTIRDQENQLLEAYENLDSISDQLDSKIVEIRELGGDVAELTKAKEELQAEKEELLENKRYTQRQLSKLRDRLDGYKELLVMKDEEIEQLKKINEELVSENTELKTEKNQLNVQLREAKATQTELNEKVQKASQLEAENIKVIAVNNRGKEREGEFRSRQVDHLKIDFNIAKNDVAPIEGKEIFIRIVDENDNVIFDVAKGSGTFMLNGEETFYTAKQEILFDNSQQQLSFIYNKGSEYESGVYDLEIYTDGYLMGNKPFRVK